MRAHSIAKHTMTDNVLLLDDDNMIYKQSHKRGDRSAEIATYQSFVKPTAGRGGRC